MTLTPFDRLLNTLTLILTPFVAPFTQGTRRPPVNGVIPTPTVTPTAVAAPAPVLEAAPAAVEPAALPALPVEAPVVQAERVDVTGLELYVRVVKGTKATYKPAPAGQTEGVYTKRKTAGGQTRYDLINPRW